MLNQPKIDNLNCRNQGDVAKLRFTFAFSRANECNRDISPVDKFPVPSRFDDSAQCLRMPMMLPISELCNIDQTLGRQPS
jgi:hypothetical protein